MSRPDSIALLRALVDAHAQGSPSDGRREPVLCLHWQGGSALQHQHTVPEGGWPDFDDALLEELRSQGLLDIGGWGADVWELTPTELGRKTVEQHDRAMSTSSAADLGGVLAAIEAQSSAGNKLAWSAVRPVLAALRAYWEAAGFSPYGVQLPPLLAALPDEHENLVRATVLQLIGGGYLSQTGNLAVGGIPIEVAITERAHAVLDGWPGAAPEELVENLVAVLTTAAATEPDPARQGRLERVLETVRELGVATASEVLSKVLLGR